MIGSRDVERLMRPVRAALDKHRGNGIAEIAATEVYNRAYEAVEEALSMRRAKAEAMLASAVSAVPMGRRTDV